MAILYTIKNRDSSKFRNPKVVNIDVYESLHKGKDSYNFMCGANALSLIAISEYARSKGKKFIDYIKENSNIEKAKTKKDIVLSKNILKDVPCLLKIRKVMKGGSKAVNIMGIEPHLIIEKESDIRLRLKQLCINLFRVNVYKVFKIVMVKEVVGFVKSGIPRIDKNNHSLILHINGHVTCLIDGVIYDIGIPDNLHTCQSMGFYDFTGKYDNFYDKKYYEDSYHSFRKVIT